MKGLKILIKKAKRQYSEYVHNLVSANFAEYSISDFEESEDIANHDIILAIISQEENAESIIKNIKGITKRMPIILLVDEKNRAQAEECLDDQVQDFLINEKFTSDELNKAIKSSLIRNKRYLKENEFNEQSQELLLHIQASIEEVIYEWNVFENTIYWCGNIHKLLGYRPGEVNNIQKWMSKTHPEELRETTESLEKALSGKTSDKWVRTYQVKNSSGEYVLLEDKIKVLKNSKGHVYRMIGVITDVTKKNEAAIRIAKSEENYTRIFNQGPMAMIIFRLKDLMIINVNKPALELYKYSIDKFIGKKIDELVCQEKVYSFNHALSKIERNGEPQPLGAWTQINAKKEFIEVEMMGRFIDIEGQLCIMLSCNDISLRMKALEDRRKANEQFELVKQATQDIIYDYDVKNDKLALDYKFQNAFGYSKEEMDIDITTWRYFIHPKETTQISISFKKALENTEQTKWQASYRVRRKNDTFAYVEDYAIIIRNDQGEAERVIGSIRDISDRVEKENMLLILQNSLEQISDSILITDANPINKPGPRIVYANKAFYKQTGYSPEEIIGNTPRILQGEKTDRSELDKLKNALKKQEPCTIKILNYKKNGEEFFAEITVDPVFDESGKCIFFSSVQRDVTERNEREATEEFFKLMNIGINEFTTLRKRYEFVIAMLTDHTGFSASEGWITGIDKKNLQRIATYYTDPDQQAFFNQEKVISFNQQEGIQGKVWQNEKIIVYNDLANHPDFVRKNEIKSTGLKSAIGIPIVAADHGLAGVIILYSKNEIKELSDNVSSKINAISERFGSELQRMRTHKELSSFFDITPDLMCVMNEQGQFKKVNNAFLALTGLNKNELAEVNALDFVHEDDKEKTRKEFINITRETDNVSDYFECRYLLKSGEIINLVWTSIYDTDEKVIYAVGKNITEQTGLQDSLIKSSNLHKAVINSTESYIWAVDRSFKLLMANDAYLKNMKTYTGQTYKIGQQVLSASSKNWSLEDSHKNLWFGNYKKALAGEDVDFMYKVNANGIQINQHISMRPIIISGEDKPMGVACFSKDITENIKYTAEIEDRNKKLSEIAHIQAHNVRGPLSRILGLSNMLLTYEQDKDNFKDTLHKLMQSADDLDQVVRDIINKTYTIDFSQNNNKQYKQSG